MATVGPFFVFPGSQANLIAAAKADIRSNAKRRVRADLAAVLKQDHHWQFDGQRAEDRIAVERVRDTACPRCGNDDLEREDNPADGVQCLECGHAWVEQVKQTPDSRGV